MQLIPLTSLPVLALKLVGVYHDPDATPPQIALIEIPGVNTAFGCTNLTYDQWVASLLLGASVIPLNVLFHMVPVSIFPSGGGGIPEEDDEEEGGEKDKKDKKND